MPELPEVETLVRQLRIRLPGRRILDAALSHDNLLAGVSKRTLLRQLPGRTIIGVDRRAKHALIRTDTRLLDVQPGMTGSLIVYEAALTDDEARYAVLRCHLDDGGLLVYRDIRRIGTLRWLDDQGWAAYAARLGPEPLDPLLTADAFAARLGASRAAIKKVLMDQRFVVGVGNIYANEALFLAGLDPSKPANRVTADQYGALLKHLQRILRAAIAAEGTTFRDYQTSTGQPGNFQVELLVYGREGEPCRHCGGILVATNAIDARQTVFCHRCQH
ncbi:MAG TPA: bifunctional DNA-formamidopyrimidine glycosylase/DNA-(apurinic or apyrimidinic site) lyase [Gemmatimonadales bacterium]|nr:bifunctional DNA-formamidopyrimidine glycosylase/DNA-(apurinic or apyrimidinic site) lyase [Gemmatimonadales bacterium]